MPYATASDYASYKGLEYPGSWDEAEIARIDAGLLQAQDDIDSALYYEFYLASSETVIAALTRATSARFDYMELTGDDGSGAFDVYDSTRIGSVALAKRVGNSTDQKRDELVAKLGTKAAQILFNAGMISGVVGES